MLKYSLSPNPFPNSLPLNGATIPTGTKIYPYYEPFVNTEAPYSAWDNGTKVGNNESQAPIEVMNGNGWTPAQGSHKLEIKDKTGTVKETANFTVGTIQPPQPPSGTKKIIQKLRSTGEIIGTYEYKESEVEIIII